jgi:hypothetical protein
VSNSQGRGGLHKQQKLILKIVYKTLRKLKSFNSTPSFQQQQQAFISANVI